MGNGEQAAWKANDALESILGVFNAAPPPTVVEASGLFVLLIG